MRRHVVKEKYRNEQGGVQLRYAVLAQAPTFAFLAFCALADPSLIGGTIALVITLVAFAALNKPMYETQSKAKTR